MAGPFDYTIDVKSPFENIAQGYQLGAGMLQARQAQEDRALALQQRQAEMERQKQIQQEVLNYRMNPTIEGVNSLSALLPPEQAKSIREGWDALDANTQQKRLSSSMQVAAALRKNPDIAVTMLEEMASGEKDPSMSKGYADAAKLAKLDPAGAFLKISAVISALPKGKESLESLLRAEKQPAEVAEAQAKAEAAGVTAKYADTKALLELDEIKNDMQIKRMNSRIYAATAAAAREANDLKRQELELKIDEMKKERDTRVREKASEAETAINGLQDTQAALADILSDQDTLRAAVGSSAWRGAIPGTKARTMAGKIERLQNMMTESMLGKLKGAMSDSDLKFLRNIGTNMDRYQNEDAFIKELNRVSGVIERTLQNQRKKYGISAPVQATPDAEIDALLEKYGVK